MPTLKVRNLAQKILFDKELSGQISDGQWENSTPWEHWKDWCRAEVVVDPDNVGTDFWPRRERYNLSSPELLSIVGDRMLEYVRAEVPDYDRKQMVRDLKDLKAIMRTRQR